MKYVSVNKCQLVRLDIVSMAYAAGMKSRYPVVVETRCARTSFEELNWRTMLDTSSDYSCVWLSDSSEV
jgi:hypothetical protein